MPRSLEVTGGGLPSQSIQLDHGSIKIGRAEANAVVLNHVNVSRSHAEIRIDDSGAQIADAGSANGTRVNGVRLEPNEWQSLQANDHIEIGPFTLDYNDEADTDSTVFVRRPVVTPKLETPAAKIEVASSSKPPEEVAPARVTPAPIAALPVQELAAGPAPLPVSPEEVPSAIPPVAPRREHSPYPKPPEIVARPLRVRQRERLALAVLAVAVLLSLPASFAAWDQRVLLNQDKFVALGNKVLTRPVVQEELARQLTAELSSTSSPGLLSDLGIPKDLESAGIQVLDSIFSDTPSAKPKAPGAAPKNSQDGFVQSIMLEVIRALPNTAISDTALTVTHKALKTAVKNEAGAGKNDVIVLDVGDGMIQLFGTAGFAGVSPADLAGNFGRIEIVRTSETARALNLARRLDGLAVPLGALVVVALAGSLYLAPAREEHLTRMGVALAGASVLWIGLVLVPMKPWILNQAVQDESSRDAANATYGVIAGSFVSQEFYIIGAGVFLVVIGLFMTSRTAKRAAGGHPSALDSA